MVQLGSATIRGLNDLAFLTKALRQSGTAHIMRRLDLVLTLTTPTIPIAGIAQRDLVWVFQGPMIRQFIQTHTSFPG